MKSQCVCNHTHDNKIGQPHSRSPICYEKKNRVNLTKEVCTLFLWWLKPRLLLVDFYYNFECDWFIELSNNNLASEIVENRSFLNQSWYITKTEFFSCFIIHFFNNVPKRTPLFELKKFENTKQTRGLEAGQILKLAMINAVVLLQKMGYHVNFTCYWTLIECSWPITFFIVLVQCVISDNFSMSPMLDIIWL